MASDEGLKRCTKCGQAKPTSEFYVRNKATGALLARCKACQDAASVDAMRRRRGTVARQREVLPAGMKRCGGCKQVLALAAFPARSDGSPGVRSLCTDCHQRANQAYRDQHRQAVQQSAASYRERNKQVLAERQRKWREEHPESNREIHSRWKADNKGAVNAATHRRRNQLACNGGHWTAQEWAELKAQYDHRCLMCGRQEPDITLTVDHVVPVSLGGSNCIDNLQPLCKSCNSKKHRGIVDLRGRPPLE